SYEAAIAARDAGDTTQALEWLRRSIAQIERQEATLETSEGRAALFATADDAFDAMIDLELRGGRSESAFAYLERERGAAKLGSTDRATDDVSLKSIRRVLPENMAFVEYAVLQDRVIAWTASHHGIDHYVIPWPRDTIAALVKRFIREASVPSPRGGDAR